MRHTCIFLLFLSFHVALMAQTFTAKAPKTVDVNATFRLQYILSDAEADGFSGPSFSDFELLNGPAVSSFSNYQVVNGRASSSSSVTYTYILAPKRKGSFTIPGATVRVGGKTYRSNSVRVNVVGNATKQQRNAVPQSADDDEAAWGAQRAGSSIGKRDLFFTITADKRKVYEQEPVMVNYKFHSRVGVGLANVMLRKKPDFKGFWTQEIELPNNLSPTTERIGNDLYRTGTNLQYLVYPQQTGQLVIPGVTFECDVMQRDASMSMLDAFFNGAGNINVKVQRSVDDLNIEVLPLPQPKPAGFSGGVGRLTMKGSLITPVPRTNDIATYRIEVGGVGNLRLVKAPKMSFPKDFDAFEAKTTDNTKISYKGMSGTMIFDYTFVPRNVGKYEIPPVEFVYFDTATGEYRTHRTAPLQLDVKQGKRSADDVEKELALRNSDIRGQVSREPTTFSERSVLWWGSLAYWIFTALLIVLYICVMRVLMKRHARNSNVEFMRQAKAGSHVTKRLKNVSKLLKEADNAAYYAALSAALQDYFSDKLNLRKAEITNDMIERCLVERGIDETLVGSVKNLLAECDFAQFAPNSDASARERLFQEAQNVIEGLERQLKHSKK